VEKTSFSLALQVRIPSQRFVLTQLFYAPRLGTGKSVLLREIMRALRKKFGRSLDAVAVTASTGMAACNIGGVTLHSFSGIGLGEGSAERLADKIRKQKKAASRWMRTQVLIIDESELSIFLIIPRSSPYAVNLVSMVDGELFDKIARIACLIRKTTKPFGGIQVRYLKLPSACIGDFAFAACCMWGLLPAATRSKRKYPSEIRLRSRVVVTMCGTDIQPH
jgi:hypothetical protein